MQPPGGQAGMAAGTEYEVTRFQGVLQTRLGIDKYAATEPYTLVAN